MIDQEMCQFSDVHYRLAIEAANVGIWDWDVIHGQQHWTNECKGMFGLPPEADVSYERFISLIHPDDREFVCATIANGFQNPISKAMEYRVIWPDGSLHWIVGRGQSLCDEQGRTIRVIGVVLDITAQKRSEELQKAADRQLHDILESVAEAFIHLDSEWRFTYVNSQAMRIGQVHSREQIIGQTFWSVHPELVGQPDEATYRQAMEKRQAVFFEMHAPGSEQWYSVHAYPAEDGGITIFLTDITERINLEQERNNLLKAEREARIEAERAHEQSEELIKQLDHEQAFLREVVKQAPCGLMIAEAPSGKIIHGNGEACRLLGYKLLESEDYRNYEQYRSIHPDGTPYLASEYPLARALLHGEVVMQEDVLYQREDGGFTHLAMNAAPIRDVQGQTQAAVVSFHDVSERYELERKKDEFICRASHELHTPLTSIKGNLQLAERRLHRILADEDRLLSLEDQASLKNLLVWVERALRQVNAENRLINDLLDATRIQAEKLQVSLEADDLTSIVCDAVNDMAIVASTRSIHLEIPQKLEIPVLADRVRIGQVVTNYLTNALKYSAETLPVTVGITCQPGEARVWVRDRGPGLSLEAQKRIWDRFYQLSSFVAYSGVGGGGMGLGLYISQELIRQHGGEVGVESATDQGSTFWFTLPLLPAGSV